MIPGLIEIDPEILGGIPVIAGTLVPLKTLIEYRLAGLPLYEFLLDFPAVTRAQGKRLWAWMDTQGEAKIKAVLDEANPPEPNASPPPKPRPHE